MARLLGFFKVLPRLERLLAAIRTRCMPSECVRLVPINAAKLIQKIEDTCTLRVMQQCYGPAIVDNHADTPVNLFEV